LENCSGRSSTDDVIAVGAASQMMCRIGKRDFAGEKKRYFY